MRIAVGTDHRGYALHGKILDLLRHLGHDVEDLGSTGEESVDYPDVAARVSRKVSQGEAERGILVCGTGLGMCIAANKFPGIRAAPCHDDLTAEMSRRHNDSNVLCLSGDLLGERLVGRMIELWLTTPFEGGRHARRLEKITAIEREVDQPHPPAPPAAG
jgi:ribose 5-phosphate isomerase B